MDDTWLIIIQTLIVLLSVLIGFGMGRAGQDEGKK